MTAVVGAVEAGSGSSGPRTDFSVSADARRGAVLPSAGVTVSATTPLATGTLSSLGSMPETMNWVRYWA